MKQENELISIITPVYNAHNNLEESIHSVIKQSYTNWELILVDDASSDGSLEIIKKYANLDNRIKYLHHSKNKGAALSRNNGLKHSRGRFITYLDSDDYWDKNKLKKQVKFMLKNNYAFTCVAYEKIDANGNSLHKIITCPNEINYNLYLRNTIIQTDCVMFDTKYIPKKLLKMPNIKKRQDAITWANILKHGYKCYGLKERLSFYRVLPNSLSSNKISVARVNWYWYRKIEKLTLIKAMYCFIGYAFNAIKKRFYYEKYINIIHHMVINGEIVKNNTN